MNIVAPLDSPSASFLLQASDAHFSVMASTSKQIRRLDRKEIPPLVFGLSCLMIYCTELKGKKKNSRSTIISFNCHIWRLLSNRHTLTQPIYWKFQFTRQLVGSYCDWQLTGPDAWCPALTFRPQLSPGDGERALCFQDLAGRCWLTRQL